jgi:hypothetical protein
LVREAQIEVVVAASGVTKFDSGGGLRVFCSVCSSPVWYEPAGFPRFPGIPLGAIDEGEVEKPHMHVWMKSRAPWVSIGDDLPHHDTHP